jgi:RNA 2',3'-cyclic 3'-phosphodiesterase
MKRCFVALTLPPETREAVARLAAGLRRLPRTAAQRLRPVAPANLHVTLKFLGSTTDLQVGPIIEALRGVAAASTVARVELCGFDAFPSKTRPRVLFAAIGAGRAEVMALAEVVETAVFSLGFPREQRPPVPHVTLARVEGVKADGPITTWLRTAPTEPLGPVDGASLVLFNSELTSTGSVYTPLVRLPLGGA